MRLTRSGLLTALLVVAALFVGSAITERIPTADAVFEGRFSHHAAVGEAVTLRTGTITVTDVRTAATVSYNGNVARTTGLWVVIDLEWTAAREPRPLPLAALLLETPDGRRFGGLPALFVTCTYGQPGLVHSCQLPLEVTPDALAGSRLLVPAGTNVDAPDDVAVIDLGVDAARAEAMAAAAGTIAVPQTAVRGVK